MKLVFKSVHKFKILNYISRRCKAKACESQYLPFFPLQCFPVDVMSARVSTLLKLVPPSNTESRVRIRNGNVFQPAFILPGDWSTSKDAHQSARHPTSQSATISLANWPAAPKTTAINTYHHQLRARRKTTRLLQHCLRSARYGQQTAVFSCWPLVSCTC